MKSFLFFVISVHLAYSLKDCLNLLPGQYVCKEPIVDIITQQPVGCSKETGLAETKCNPSPKIECNGMRDIGGKRFFLRNITCLWTNGYQYETALMLSIFGGIIGLDRFYLGYIALGSLKMWTFGGMGLWYLLDIVLLLNNNLHPADRSNLTHPYYSPALTYLHDLNSLQIEP